MEDFDVNLSADAAVENEAPTDDEMEEFVGKIMARAASLTGVKIDRGIFLRTELKKHYPEINPTSQLDLHRLRRGFLLPISTLWH